MKSHVRLSYRAALAGSMMVHLCFWSALDAQECPKGWKEIASDFVRLELERDAQGAAAFVLPEERAGWGAWKEWEWARLARNISEMPEPVQERARNERAEALGRLEVSSFTCQPSPTGVADSYLVRIDPDGRSYRTVDMVEQEGSWFVRTGTTALDAEQMRVVTAYWMAADELRWDEAEAWVARQALPRFQGYRLEVERFLSGSPAFAGTRERQAEQRQEEWDEKFIRAQVMEDGIVVVSAEFPSAKGLSSEMIQVDGAWRILHR